MIAPEKSNLVRVSLTLDPEDVALLDRLAVLEGKNRSFELRSILANVRPVLTVTVNTIEAAMRQRQQFDEAVASGALGDLEALMPEVEKMQATYLGAMSRLEGAAAAAAADPQAGSHGGHTPTPTSPPTPSEEPNDA